MLKSLISPNLQKWAQDILLLIIRLWIANIFLRSGLLKIMSWDATISLFQDEYALPFLPPSIAAILGTMAEIGAGAFILIGLLTPLAAIALLGVTLVIELLVYPGTNDHYHWMLLLGVLIFFGGGRLSADNFIFKKK